MLRIKKLLLPVIILALPACKKTSPDKTCDPVSLKAETSPSHPCIAEGTIIITAPLYNGWLYKIGSSYQSQSSFLSLKPGNYTVTAKNESNCIYTADIIIAEKKSGPLFSSVKNLLAVNCSSCHSDINPQAGLNWTSSCDILTYWDRIKARAVDGNPSTMPPGGLLPVSERTKIMDWINAGHRFAD